MKKTKQEKLMKRDIERLERFLILLKVMAEDFMDTGNRINPEGEFNSEYAKILAEVGKLLKGRKLHMTGLVSASILYDCLEQILESIKK